MKHKNGNEKLNDQKYITKREANRRSVQLHRKNNPKQKYDDLENETKSIYKEAEMIENFLKEHIGVNIQNGIKEKLRVYGDFRELFD